MEIKPISSRMYGFLVLYDMHTKFFARVIDGISDEDALKRLNTKANHISWLAGSVVQQRFEIAKELGFEGQQVAHELFDNGKGIQDQVTYPSLADFKKDWDTISPVLRETLLNASDERLDKSFEMPGMVIPLFDMIAFIVYREASIIGQLALWRRLLGYDAVRYD